MNRTDIDAMLARHEEAVGVNDETGHVVPWGICADCRQEYPCDAATALRALAAVLDLCDNHHLYDGEKVALIRAAIEAAS